MDWMACHHYISVAPPSEAFAAMQAHIESSTTSVTFLNVDLNVILRDDFRSAFSEEELVIFHISQGNEESLLYAIW